MNPIQVIFFDYYMTLVELNDPFAKISGWFERFLTQSHPEIDLIKFNQKFTRNRVIIYSEPVFRLGIDILLLSLEKTCNDLGIPGYGDNFRPFIEELFSTPKAYEDSAATVAALKQNYKVGLLTNADNYILQRSLSRQPFRFDFVITSEDAQCNKPGKAIFDYALTQLNISSQEAVMAGDSLFDDISGAHNAGIHSIWVNRKNEPLKEGLQPPEYTVRSLREIPDLFPLVEL